MRKKSDKRPARISATEASRSFSQLLDEVEAGRRFVVHRRGRDVCAMVPPQLSGRPASECLEILRERTPVQLDDGFGDDLQAILAEEMVEDRPPWDS